MMREFKITKYLEPFIHIIIWGSLFLALWQNAINIGTFRKQDGSIYLPLIWSTICSLVLFYLNSLYLVPHFVSKQLYKAYILWAILLYISIVSINTILDHFYTISLLSSEKEPFFVEITLNLQSKMMIVSLSLGYGLTRQWIKEERIRQQLIKEKLISELKYLKAQINPHFLFNTLNMAYASAIKSNDNGTADIIEKLSVLMRYVLYESNEDKVALEKEIDYVDNYINLQLQRLSAELAVQVNYQLKGDWQNYTVAPMILIPFIENVFKHGILLSKKNEIFISIFLNSNTLVLETKNVIIHSSTSPNHVLSGIGLKNTKKRLELLYPNQHSLVINDVEDYFHVRLEIQLK